MLSDRSLAGLCAASYSYQASWDKILFEDSTNPVQLAVKYADGITYIVFPGSQTPLDWFEDLQGIPATNSLVGRVEMGFNHGLERRFAEIKDFIGEHSVVCGHSLGAARACIFGGMLAASQKPPLRIAAFGCPRPGYDQLTETLKLVSMGIYRNRCDPVTYVPMPIPLIGPWQHNREIVHIDIAPSTMDGDPTPWADFNDATEHFTFRDHHIELYVAGVPA